MILYFSGTGNSAHIAESLGQKLDDQVIDLFSYIKANKKGDFYSKKTFVIVSPTHGRRAPRFFTNYLKKCKFSGNKDLYYVLNYGSECGNAYKYIKKDIESLGLNFKGLFGIRMPENYIMLFELDTDQVNQKIAKEAEGEITKLADLILANKDIEKGKISLMDRILSSLVNSVFFKFIVKDKKFYYTEKCIKCGLCAKVCPLNNIDYKDGHPIRKGNCTHCAACISKCPTAAIEYGKKTLGKKRYLYK